MKKFTNFVIDKRYYILVLFIILSVLCGFLSTKVKINYDIAKYLPNTSETRIGMNIMEKEFSEVETSSLNLMFENLSKQEKKDVLKYLETVKGVDEVEYDDTEKYNKDGYTLYSLIVSDKSDSKLSSDIYDKIIKHFENYKVYTSGNIASANEDVLPIWIVGLAIFCALIILIIMCESYFEPFLFLISILMAVLLNNGTNIIFSDVSFITSSISAILQLALSMDYSIMLMNRYNQEKETEKDNVKAMKQALCNAFQSISSSSVTTIVGLLALVFMSFTIGRDLGFVLAKGVLFSLVCIFFVLPTLILMFNNLIVKTKKKNPTFKMNILGKFSYRLRYMFFPLFLVICVGSFILKGNLGYDYTNNEDDEIAKVFKENNQMAIIYNNSDEDKITKYLEKIANIPKVDEVLGYGNTINQKLAYDKLNNKLKDLGSDVDVDDYLLKIIYSNYYNKEGSRISFPQFVTFIENVAYNNDKLDTKIDDEVKKNVTRLKNFTSIEKMNEPKSSHEIASILNIDESEVQDLFIYYLSEKSDIKLSLPEFINFMNQYVLTSDKYAHKIDDNIRKNLRMLSKFTNQRTLSTKMTYKQMADLFEIDDNLVNDLYKYYISINNINIKLTIGDFANFILNDVLSDDQYRTMFKESDIKNIEMVATFSNPNIINQSMTSSSLASLFGINEDIVKKVLLFKYMSSDNGTKLSISEAIKNSLQIKNSTHYLDGIDLSSFEKLYPFAVNQDSMNIMPMDKENLKNIFDNISYGLVDKVYYLAKLPDETKITPQAFVNMLVSYGNLNPNLIDKQSLNSLNILKMVIDSSVGENNEKLTATDMAKILNISPDSLYNLYALIDLTHGNTNNWQCSPKEFVRILLENSNNESVKEYLDDKTLQTLNLLSNIMESSLSGKTYSYEEVSNVLGIDVSTVKSIYALYVANHDNIKLSPTEFVDIILSHKDDKMLKGSISSDTVASLNLINKVMKSVVNNTKLNSTDLSKLLNVNNDDLKLIYGLYNYTYQKQNFTISLKEFINFILNNVITNEEYSKNFDNDKLTKLNTVNGIMNSVINNTKYTSDEIFAILTNLADDIDKNTIEVLYTYYDSENNYNLDWTLTVEEFVNYLNDEILKDERFTDFIDNNMQDKITDSKQTIVDAKKLLLGNNYSRIVLNTRFDTENEETFHFIQQLKDTLGKDIDDFYIIGDSPMAYDMSGSFADELNYITIITMIVIFVVVAFTFRSAIIPIILVLTIQCAVYVTMGILSFAGDNVYFIAILIVQSILMGATIDYAILYTSYYIEHRQTMNIKDAIISSYNKSINTILTSASILTIVTLIVGHFASAIASKICMTISQGTICSTLLILFILPSVIAACDKIIVKRK